MTTFATIIKTAAAAILLTGGAALAETSPTPVKYQCWDGSIKADPSQCPTMTPAQHETWSQSQSNATGGNSNSNSNATGGAGGSSTANATGGKGGAGGNANQKQGQSQGQSSRNTNRNQSSARASGGNQSVNIDNSNRQRMAANTAAMVIPGGYGPANCYGDTNPSGSFGASMQVFGWGVAANSQKASNVCAVAALAGHEVALRYLQRMDHSVPRRIEAMVPTGRLICPAYAPTFVAGKGCK